MSDLRDAFMRDVSVASSLQEGFDVLTTAIRLPNGAIEVATNTTNLTEKIMYIVENYNDNFELKNNTKIKVIGYMLV